MILIIVSTWAVCGILSATFMSRILSHARAMTREQRKLNH